MRVLLLASLGLAACSSDSIDSDEQARRAYLGLDPSVEKSIALGFDGFNAASSANIPTQMAAGDLTGTIAIDGQVDQGASARPGAAPTPRPWGRRATPPARARSRAGWIKAPPQTRGAAPRPW